MKTLILILLLVTPCYSGNQTHGGGASYSGKEQFGNAICVRVEQLYRGYNRGVKCKADNDNYHLQIWTYRETEAIDSYMARVIFYDAAKTYYLMKPKSLRVSNNYGASNKRSFNDLVREFGK